jgi:hypothetical protein
MRYSKLILTLFLIGIFASLDSCKKQSNTINQKPVLDSSHFSITNASPAISNLQFYLNSQLFPLPDSPISYGKTVYASYIRNATTYFPDTALLPYINIPSGYQQIAFGSYGSRDLFSIINNKFEVDNSYSFFITDTIHHGQITTVLLEDHIATTDSNTCQIRFLNLSPDAPPLDVWAYPNAGYDAYKIFSNCAYLPNDYNSFVDAESFSVIPAGPYYFEATVAGTSQVVLGGLLVIPGNNVVTIYSKGYINGTGRNAIDVGVIEYKP